MQKIITLMHLITNQNVQVKIIILKYAEGKNK